MAMRPAQDPKYCTEAGANPRASNFLGAYVLGHDDSATSLYTSYMLHLQAIIFNKPTCYMESRCSIYSVSRVGGGVQ